VNATILVHSEEKKKKHLVNASEKGGKEQRTRLLHHVCAKKRAAGENFMANGRGRKHRRAATGLPAVYNPRKKGKKAVRHGGCEK